MCSQTYANYVTPARMDEKRRRAEGDRRSLPTPACRPMRALRLLHDVCDTDNGRTVTTRLAASMDAMERDKEAGVMERDTGDVCEHERGQTRQGPRMSGRAEKRRGRVRLQVGKAEGTQKGLHGHSTSGRRGTYTEGAETGTYLMRLSWMMVFHADRSLWKCWGENASWKSAGREQHSGAEDSGTHS